MRNKFLELLNLTRKAKQQGIGMQRRLLVYWISMMLVVFATFLVLLSAAGVFSDSEEKLQQILGIQQKTMVTDLNTQLGRLTAQGIRLSEDASAILEDHLFASSIQTLNNNPEQLRMLEEELYIKLKTALQSNPCNGIWVLLDATTNTAAKGAERSRAGLYIRFANLNDKDAIDQDVTLYRGIPDIARENQMELHNRWRQEFNTANILGYDVATGQTVNRLADSCVWTGRVRLPETWEDVTQLMVPILDGDGSVCGLCGIELSDLYFRLSYPSVESDFGNMITVLAPIRDGQLILPRGMIGSREGIALQDGESLAVREGKHFNTYTGSERGYLGVHTLVDMRMADGSQMAAVTLIPEETYLRTSATNNAVWIIGSMILLAAMLAVSVYLSRKYVQPISQSLAAIQSGEPVPEALSGISEIDALLSFVRSRAAQTENSLPPEIMELLDAFAARAQTLTPTERNILKYYAEGKDREEIAEIACISIHTVRKHTGNMYQKLEVSAREELMLYMDLFRRCGRLDELFKGGIRDEA